MGNGIPTDGFEQVEVASAGGLRDWLSANHDRGSSVWLVTWKKAVADRYVSREEVLDELVAFGWTDGVRRTIDDEQTMQLVGPRKAGHWARTYRDRAARLVEEGRMHPAGLASMEEAKRAGTWDDHDDVDQLLVPDDLTEALAAVPGAVATFAAFPPSHRRNVLRWIRAAKTDPTREKRLRQTAELAGRGERIPSL